MRILAVGGGSGGHVTPVVVTLNALAKDGKNDEVRVWCDAGFYSQCLTMLERSQLPVKIEKISAGKFRRYHKLSLWNKIRYFYRIGLPNIIDLFKVCIGFLQSFIKLCLWRPDVVFCKGGYVCLPVGAAAHLLRIPIVIHDSDAHPGLTNRILSRWATKIATGAPLENYPYPKQKARYVGIPVDDRLRPHGEPERRAAKRLLGLDVNLPLIVITGGGLGAETINTATVSQLPALLKRNQVILISGTSQYEQVRDVSKSYETNERFQLHAFVSEKMVDMLIAADVVVSRAGATTLLELAALGKPTVLVPNPYLTGGHQVKNAKMYHDAQAVVMIDEEHLVSHPAALSTALDSILNDITVRRQLSQAIHRFAHPNAARDVAHMIRSAAKKKGKTS